MSLDPLAFDLGRPTHLIEVAEKLRKRFAEKGVVPPPYDYDGLVERFDRGEPLTRRDRRKLAWALNKGDPPLVARSCFSSALEVISGGFRSSSLRGAIHCYLEVRIPSGHRNVRTLEAWVKRKLREYRGKDPTLLHWRGYLEVFEGDAGSRLAGRLLGSDNLDRAFQETRLPPASHVARATLRELARKMGCEDPRLEELLRLVEERFPWEVAMIVGELLGPRARRGLRDRVPLVEEFALRHMGDPRLDRRGLWHSEAISEEVRRMVVRWVAERDLHLFYEHVSGDRLRLDFWRQFLDEVHYSRVILGENARRQATPEIRKAIRAGHIARLERADPGLSAFILGIGDWYIVEFSKVGHATYAYRSRHLTKGFLDGETYRIGQLKFKGSGWPYRIIHPARKLKPAEWTGEYKERLINTLGAGLPPTFYRS